MFDVAKAVAVVVLVAHGVIHLLGTAVYMQLAEIEGLAFKTTVLAGTFDLGVRGAWLFGALWALPAAGFIASAFAMVQGWSWWPRALLSSAVLSLALTTLDWQFAFVGAIVNLAIVAFAMVRAGHVESMA